MLPHRPHPLADLETRVVLQSQIKVVVHDVVLLQLVPFLYQGLVLADHIFPFQRRISERRNCPVKCRLASFILSSHNRTRMSRHF